MAKFLTTGEIIAGNAGQVIATINGTVREMAEVRKLTATIAKTKTAHKVMGLMGTLNKSTGFAGTGTMTIYYNTSIWAEIMHNYTANGVDTDFSIIVVNEDPSSSVGAQRIRLNGVNINDLIIARVDADTDALDQDIAFTFLDYDILKSFDPY